MKGLLLKDLYMARKYLKSYIFLVAIFLAVSCIDGQNLFFVFYPCMICGMIPMTLLAYDERAKWDVFSCTLPCTRAQVVSAKYLLGLAVQVVLILLTLLTQSLRMHVAGSVSWKEMLVLLETLVVLSCLSSGITMPFTFKLGLEKGRLAYYFMIGIMCAGSFIAADLFENPDTTVSTTPGLGLLCLIAIAGYALSWYLSIYFYKKREF